MRNSGRLDVQRHAPASSRSLTSWTTYAMAYGSFILTTWPFAAVRLSGLRRMGGVQASCAVLHPAARRTRSAPHPLIALVAIDDAIFHYKEYLFGLMYVCTRISWHGDHIGNLARFKCTQSVGHTQQLGIH